LKRLAALTSVVALAVGCGGDDGPKLEGPFWVLEAGRDVPLEPGITATASFREGTVRGYTGCNQYTAPYTTEGESLEIGAVASTRMACPPPRDAIEQAYVAALDEIASWTVDGEELVLSDGSGEELLRYTQARTGGDT
jgi:heat shock protein HslJ